MLMIRSTPRITYKMGTRAVLGAVEDKALPWLVSEAPSVEVAADFTGIYRSLMWIECLEGKTTSFNITKVPAETSVWHGFGNGTHRLLAGAWATYVLSVSLLLLRVINS